MTQEYFVTGVKVGNVGLKCDDGLLVLSYLCLICCYFFSEDDQFLVDLDILPFLDGQLLSDLNYLQLKTANKFLEMIFISIRVGDAIFQVNNLLF